MKIVIQRQNSTQLQCFPPVKDLVMKPEIGTMICTKAWNSDRALKEPRIIDFGQI
jgi:hypothetical protein